MTISQDESGRVLKIAGTLEIGGADELHIALSAAIHDDARPAVDLSEVDACDTAALQLLCSACKTTENFELVGVSTAIRNASEALGLSLRTATTGDERAT